MSEVVDQPKVPKVRFPEFEGEWEERRVGSTIELVSGQHLGPDDYGPRFEFSDPYFSGPTDFTNELDAVSKFTDRGSKHALAGDVLMTVKGSGVGALWNLTLSKVAIGRQLMAIRSGSAPASLIFHLFSPIKHRFEALASGNMIPGLSRQDILTLKFYLPQLPAEQERIASVLTAIDKRVALLKRRQKTLAAYKKGMMQRLFSRELRFTRDDGSPFPAWQEKRLSEVLCEHGERSTGQERVHSVSVHKGVIDQVEHLGRSFAAASTDHYGLVKSGDVVYTKSPTGDFPFGIIKQNRLDENVIVSPLYGVFTPETYALGYILNDHFLSVQNTHNYLHQLVQKGAKNTINITNSGFLEGRLTLPVDHDEQQKIAAFLSSLDTKIDAVANQIDAMQRFKKGLLQQMFV